MRRKINTPRGCKYGQRAKFLHPSRAPLIDIYQAAAQRTTGAVAPAPLIYLPCLLGLHPSRSPLVAPFAMLKIAPFNLAGRALSTGDTTSRVTNQAGVTTTVSAAGLQRAHPMHPANYQGKDT